MRRRPLAAGKNLDGHWVVCRRWCPVGVRAPSCACCYPNADGKHPLNKPLVFDGATLVTYDVPLWFTGVVELFWYEGGTRKDRFFVGGAKPSRGPIHVFGFSVRPTCQPLFHQRPQRKGRE